MTIKEMMQMQDRLNRATAGESWKWGTASNGKKINWWRCIHMEAAEFINSFPWKHWKDVGAKPDIENAKMELVDIWHFILSEAIRDGYEPNEIELINHNIGCIEISS